ncbi:MAG: hypothetical protein KGZ40_09090 [Clostridiales bacterium]|nr:hypothetical protein [Clostridiales bacterium]
MRHNRPLAPCFIGSGIVASPRDMIRVLETLESVFFSYSIDDDVVAEGEATLVKIMADSESATMAVNGCLFLNVSSFRYLEFETIEDDLCSVRLHGDGAVLRLLAVRDAETPGITVGQMRLIEESEFELSSFVGADDEEDDD